MLEFDSATRLPPACEVYEKGISLGGMSKTFSMPGLRIGWLAMQDETLMKRVAAYKDYTTICNSAPSEILALIGLRNADKVNFSYTTLHAHVKTTRWPVTAHYGQIAIVSIVPHAHAMLSLTFRHSCRS